MSARDAILTAVAVRGAVASPWAPCLGCVAPAVAVSAADGSESLASESRTCAAASTTQVWLAERRGRGSAASSASASEPLLSPDGSWSPAVLEARAGPR